MSEEITKDLEKIAPKGWKRYPRYKDSGIEWIGEIPEGWDVAKLKRAVNHVGRGISPEYAEKSSIAVVNQACIYWEGMSEDALKYHEETNISELRKGLLKKGDLLLNSTGTGTLGRALLFNLDRMCVADSHMTIVRCDRKLLIPSFLRLLVETPLYQSKILNELVAGSTNQIELSREKLRNLIIPLPTAKEQQWIVSGIREKTAEIDSLISKKQRLIELLKEKRAVIITRAVTEGLDPNAPMKDSGVEWIGEIPEGWDVAKLKRAANHVGRGISPKYAEKSSIAVVNQACIYWEGMSEDALKYHEETNISELRKGLLKKGDLLLNSTGTGTLGRALLFNLDRMCVADSHMTIVRCDRKLLIPSFLRLLVETPLYQSKILNELVAGSTNQIELSREKLRNLIVILPPIEEQERIVGYVTERNHKLDSFISKIEKSIELLKEYRSALITAAVTGKIDVREEVP